MCIFCKVSVKTPGYIRKRDQIEFNCNHLRTLHHTNTTSLGWETEKQPLKTGFLPLTNPPSQLLPFYIQKGSIWWSYFKKNKLWEIDKSSTAICWKETSWKLDLKLLWYVQFDEKFICNLLWIYSYSLGFHLLMKIGLNYIRNKILKI